MSKIAMVPCWSLRPSTSCFPGYAIFSPTVSTTAPSCVRHSPNSASGPSRSSNAPLTRSAFNCCRAVGSSNEPWLGSIETAAWQRISKRRSRAAKRGFTSPRYSSLSGDWLDQYTTIYDTLQPYRLRFRHLGSVENQGSQFDALARQHISGSGRVVKGGMSRKPGSAILGGVIAFDQDGLVRPHLRHVEPPVRGVVSDAVGLARPIAIDKVGGYEIRERDAGRVADGERRIAQGSADRSPHIDDLEAAAE